MFSDELKRMDATHTIGTQIEWNSFKKMVCSIADESNKSKKALLEKVAENKNQETKIKKLERANSSLLESNKFYKTGSIPREKVERLLNKWAKNYSEFVMSPFEEDLNKLLEQGTDHE